MSLAEPVHAIGYSTNLYEDTGRGKRYYDDYETNRSKSGAVGVIGLVFSAVWIYFLASQLSYNNTQLGSPAGTSTNNNATNDNCLCSFATNTGYLYCGDEAYLTNKFTAGFTAIN